MGALEPSNVAVGGDLGRAKVDVPPAWDALVMVIDCDECVMEGTAACDDCVVSFLVGRKPGDAVVFDAAEERAVALLQHEGLVPRLRLVKRTA